MTTTTDSARSGDRLVQDQFYIGGTWTPSTSGTRINVHEAATGEIFAEVAEASEQDIDTAVKAAAEAYPSWSATAVDDRLGYLEAISQGIADRTEDLARSIAREVGSPIRMARAVQVGNPIAIIAGTAAAVRDFQFQEQIGNDLVIHGAVGVVAAITPWNYPLQQVVAKVAPALAAGCTVVLKASEVAPLTAFTLAEIAAAAGLPPGVLNVISGTGVTAGEGLVLHPLVDKISFTGSTRAGRRISQLAAETVTPVTLELGGKSASVLLPDADIEKAAKFAVYNAFSNAGQTCTALTRLLVPAGSRSGPLRWRWRPLRRSPWEIRWTSRPDWVRWPRRPSWSGSAATFARASPRAPG